MKKYKAQGFVEALIAILITGIASIALLDMASKSIAEVVRSEMYDELTQTAVEGSEMIRYLVDDYSSNIMNVDYEPASELFPPEFGGSWQTGFCYALLGDINDPQIDMSNKVCEYSEGTGYSGIYPAQCLDNNDVFVKDKSGLDTDIFRIMCIAPGSRGLGDRDLLIAKIYTGLAGCKSISEEYGLIDEVNWLDGKCSIYEHTAVFGLPKTALP